MPIDNDEMLAAMSDSLEPTASEPEATPQEPISETPAVVEDDPAAENSEADGEQETVESEAGKPDGAQTAKTPAVAETPEAKADREKREAEAAARPKDPVNDPIGPNTKKETKERIEALIGKVKDLDQKYRAPFDELMGAIQETKATPQQYGQVLDYLRMVNSGDPVQIKNAIGVMQRELAALSRMAGVPVPGVDVLTEHPDLQQKVYDGTLAQEDAEELAAARNQRALQTQHSQARSQQTEQEHKVFMEVNRGKADLNALERELATDPHYQAKRQVLVRSLQPVFNQIHPSRWAATFREAYAALPNPAPAPAPVAVPTAAAVPAQQPMRAKNPAGGQRPAPTNLFDAIDAGIAQARGG